MAVAATPEPSSSSTPGPAVVSDDLAGADRSRPFRIALIAAGVGLLSWMILALVLAQTEGTETRTRTLPGPTSTSHSSTSTSVPSEAVLLALLATGAVLVLSGALYARLSTIKLPGAELVLTPEEREGVAAQVAAKASAAATASDLARATATAVDIGQVKKSVAKQLAPSDIEQAALSGLRIAGLPAVRPTTVPALTGAGRLLNVVLGPGSDAHRATRPPLRKAGLPALPPSLAPGFEPQPEWNLAPGSGRTIAHLAFANRYVGSTGAWSQADTENIDQALQAAMSDAALESVVAQYFDPPAAPPDMLPSARREVALPAIVYKDTAEHLVEDIYNDGDLAGMDLSRTVLNIMLPDGIVLSDGFSPGFQPPAGVAGEAERRRARTITLDDGDAASSRRGLGGYHGSVDVAAGVTVYYAVGVYSNGGNGIAVFDEPWKNVVATFYHELNEARTDPDVEAVNATGNGALLGWYSQIGRGEIGDLPINACGGDLRRVFREVPLAAGGGSVPIQLMWSNLAYGPALST
jgi:hypothetical protein